MFHVKICGVTTPADARAAVEAGADAIGLNFVEGSPRKLDPSHAMNVSKSLPVGVVRVGVFADCSSEEILRIVRSVGLDAVQLHGNEPPEILDAFARAAVPVIRSARLSQGPDPLEEIRQWIKRASRAGVQPAMVLVDATVSGQLGGTGTTVDWKRLSQAASLDIPIVLAGGLSPVNVEQAIRCVRPFGVDVASGVEISPGQKDKALMQAFVLTARMALGVFEGH